MAIPLTPKFQRVRDKILSLGLGHLSLGREMDSLSGGETQRVYLLDKMTKNLQDHYVVIENISFGLSLKEYSGLYEVLRMVRDQGNTVVILDKSPGIQEFADYNICLTNAGLATGSWRNKGPF